MLLAALCGPTDSEASIGITVCNKGTVKVHVAYLDDSRALLNTMNFWKAKGWYSVSPSECKSVWRDDGVVHLVFAIRTPKGDLGVYQPSLDWRGIGSLPPNNRRSEICVPTEAFEESGNMNQPVNYIPPCSGKFKRAPTAGSFYLEGQAHLTLNVSPTESSYQTFATYLERGNAQSDAGEPTWYEVVVATRNTIGARVWRYKNREEALRIAQSLADSQQLPALVVGPLDDGNHAGKYEVRVSPLATEALGWHAQHRLGAIGYTGSMITTRPRTSESTWYEVVVATRNTIGARVWRYKSRDEAQRIAQTLADSQRLPTLVAGPLDDDNYDGKYEVRVSPFATEALGMQVQQQLSAIGYNGSMIRRRSGLGEATWHEVIVGTLNTVGSPVLLYERRKDADRVAQTLAHSQQRLPTVVVGPVDNDKYQVRVAPLATEALSRQVQQQLSAMGYKGSVMTKGGLDSMRFPRVGESPAIR